jgi:hypothetical protein
MCVCVCEWGGGGVLKFARPRSPNKDRMTVHLMCACVRVVIPYLAHTVPDPLFPTVTFVVMGFQRAEDSSHRLWPELGECVIPSSRVSPRRSVNILFTILKTYSFPFPLPPPPPSLTTHPTCITLLTWQAAYLTLLTVPSQPTMYTLIATAKTLMSLSQARKSPSSTQLTSGATAA